MICWWVEILLDLVHGFVLLRVDLASPTLPTLFHQPICSISTSLTSSSPEFSQFIFPSPIFAQAPDDRKRSDVWRWPDDRKRPDVRETLKTLKFDSAATTITPTFHHIFQTDIHLHLPRYLLWRFWHIFVLEILSCGSRILLCFGYLGTVRLHQHHDSTSQGSHHCKDGNFDEIFVITCNCIDNPHCLILHSLPIETSGWVLQATRLVHISDHTT